MYIYYYYNIVTVKSNIFTDESLLYNIYEYEHSKYNLSNI